MIAKIHFVDGQSEGESDQQVLALERHGCLTTVEKADVIYCGSIISMKQSMDLHNNTGKPLVVYCWDYYKWAHEGLHKGYDWITYAEMMQGASLVLVPSNAQKRRLKELLDIDAKVVTTGFPTYEAETLDGGFILDPVRYYPEENRTWAEEAANKLGIPIVHSEHQFSKEEFRKLVASCTFMTCAYREASTGGLTLMEGLNLGKVALVSDSPYQGAKDYVGPFGYYFKHDDFRDLVRQMKKLWKRRPVADVETARKYINKKLTYDTMARNINKEICGLLKRLRKG